jgi:hypothetical protein
VRWIWALVFVCLVGAPVRLAPLRDGRDAATLEVAAKALPVVAHRRDGTCSPDLRLVAIAPAAVVVITPPVARSCASRPRSPRSISVSCRPRSSRGPPVVAA